MNWDAIGAIGEIIGALAVVISLLYLSSQIRHSTKTAEDAAFRDIFASTGELLGWMNEPTNRKILMKGLLDYHSLNGEEKFACDSMFTVLVTFVESSVISNAAELVQDETMENWAQYLQTRYFSYPGPRAWWEGTRRIYIEELQGWFDEMIQSADHESDYWGIKTPSNKAMESGT